MVERSAVNRLVVGSNPTSGAKFLLSSPKRVTNDVDEEDMRQLKVRIVRDNDAHNFGGRFSIPSFGQNVAKRGSSR